MKSNRAAPAERSDAPSSGLHKSAIFKCKFAKLKLIFTTVTASREDAPTKSASSAAKLRGDPMTSTRPNAALTGNQNRQVLP